MLFFEPQKGKAFDKLPKKTLSTFEETTYLQSIKYDGNQVFVCKIGYKVRYFTSDWKEFYLDLPTVELMDINHDFILIAEALYDSEGKLGARQVVQGKLTTCRVAFKKGIPHFINESKFSFKVFDCLMVLNGKLQTDAISLTRVQQAGRITQNLTQFDTVSYTYVLGKDAKAKSKHLVKEGWEGTMLIEPDEVYHIGKRVNHSIKLKHRPTVDLLCIDTELGDGKYSDKIGALVLKDSEDRIVRVGSGLSDTDRSYHPDYFIGKVIEIEYEQILDTYIQPTFIQIREDKSKSD